MKRLILTLVCVCGLHINSSVFAHSGGTNAEGCHTNRKTGEYHCHGGKRAPKEREAPTDPRRMKRPITPISALLSVDKQKSDTPTPMRLGPVMSGWIVRQQTPCMRGDSTHDEVWIVSSRHSLLLLSLGRNRLW